MSGKQHFGGQQVRSIHDDRREGIVIKSDPNRTLIEFTEWDEVGGEHYTHRKWLPTRHWVAA